MLPREIIRIILKIKWWTFRKRLLENTLFDFENVKLTKIVFPTFEPYYSYFGRYKIQRPKLARSRDEYYYVDTGKTLCYNYSVSEGLSFYIVVGDYHYYDNWIYYRQHF